MERTELLKGIGLAKRNFRPIVKDGKNPHFKSTYATLAAILAAVEIPLLDEGVLISHTLDHGTDGSMMLRTSLTHWDTGASIETSFPIAGNDPQRLGSALTYARRYNLLNLLNLATEDDDGEAASHRGQDPQSTRKNTTKAVEPSTPVSPVRAIVADLVKVTGFDPQILKAIAKANGLPEKSGDMTEANAKDFQRACLCNWLCQRYVGMAPDVAAKIVDDATTPGSSPLVVAETLTKRLSDWQPPGGLAREKPVTTADGLSLE